MPISKIKPSTSYESSINFWNHNKCTDRLSNLVLPFKLGYNINKNRKVPREFIGFLKCHNIQINSLLLSLNHDFS